MKTKWYLAIALPLACAFLASFVTLPGSHSFEVYLNNDFVMKEYVTSKGGTKPLTLDKNSTGTMTVNYDHCGVTGTSRSLSLLDEQRNLLKEWKFADVSPSVKDPMPIPVKDILSAANGKTATLFYNSSELDHPMMLAPLKLIDKSTASN